MGSTVHDSYVCAAGGVPLILILVAALGAVLASAGVAMVSVPAGMVVAGVLLMAAAYLVAEEREQ